MGSGGVRVSANACYYTAQKILKQAFTDLQKALFWGKIKIA